MADILSLVKAVVSGIGRVFGKHWVRLGLIATASIVVTTLILSLGLLPTGYDLVEGELASTEIRAPRAAVDPVETEKKMAEAEKVAVEQAREDPAYWMIDPYAAADGVDDLRYVFATAADMRQSLFYVSASSGDAGGTDASQDKLSTSVVPVTVVDRKNPPPTGAEIDASAERMASVLRESRGIDLSIGACRALLRSEAAVLKQVEEELSSVISDFLEKTKISADDLQARKNDAEKRVRGLGMDPDLTAASVELVRGLIRENTIPDNNKLESVKAEARNSVEPVFVQKGEIIVSQGSRVTSDDIEVLKELGLLGKRTSWLSLIGLTLFVVMAFAFLGIHIARHHRTLLINDRAVTLLALIVVMGIALTQLVSVFFRSPSTGGSGFLVPVAFATMLVSILIDSSVAVVAAVVLSAVVGLVFDGSYRFVFVSLVGGITGAFSISRHSDRSGLMRSGFIVAEVQMLAVAGVYMIVSDFQLVQGILQAGVVGILSAVLATGTLPFLENIFGVTSSIRFLELANPNQPLLKRMLVEAPGTYHHSVIVGNLAEAAANDVGADALLVRVGALYHDIGKLKRPYFFIENQLGQDNPHDKLSPTLSTLIITSHAKDGVDMARQAKLPSEVVDIVSQHHGTSLVSFFHRRAQENADRTEEPTQVDEADFRYPGPRPATEEAAIVMLADSVEAAVRSLNRPTPERIESLVKKIVRDRLNDGQLDECQVTLRDLDRICDAFVRVLTGIFHARVEYPEAVIKEMQKRGEDISGTGRSAESGASL